MQGQRVNRSDLRKRIVAIMLLGLVAIAAPVQNGVAHRATLPNLYPFVNPDGIAQTLNTNGDIDLTGPFFQSLGTNGRSCASCHLPDQGWSISASGVQARFAISRGTDP